MTDGVNNNSYLSSGDRDSGDRDNAIGGTFPGDTQNRESDPLVIPPLELDDNKVVLDKEWYDSEEKVPI